MYFLTMVLKGGQTLGVRCMQFVPFPNSNRINLCHNWPAQTVEKLVKLMVDIKQREQ